MNDDFSSVRFQNTPSVSFGLFLGFVLNLCALMTTSHADNWLLLQGTEPAAKAAPRVWGFVQPELQVTRGTALKVGAWGSQPAVFNQIRPDLTHHSNVNMIRARLGVRGILPATPNVNYFILIELGNNGITRGSGNARLTDASVTLNYLRLLRVRIGLFKYPGSEEGLRAIHVFDYVNFSQAVEQLLLERFVSGDGSETPANGAAGSAILICISGLSAPFAILACSFSMPFESGGGRPVTPS